MGITKRYRLVIDYEVEVSDWEPSGWHSGESYPDFGTPGFDEWAENQHRLFDAVLKDPKRVEHMCKRSVLDTLEMDLERVRRQFEVPSEDALFAETFAEMCPKDRAYWENICGEHLFSENADFVTYRFQSFVQSCTIQNLETGELIEAQPDEAEPLENHSSDGGSIFLDAEAFGTWAGPQEAGLWPERHKVEGYAPNAKRLEEMRKQVSLTLELPGGIKKFLQQFVIHRTIFRYVNGDAPNAVVSDEQITLEANEWVAGNPALSKQDVSCLKVLLRKFGLPKLFRHNFVQDMRKETFAGFCQAVLQNQRFWD